MNNRNHYRIEFQQVPLDIIKEHVSFSGRLKDMSGNGIGFISSIFFNVDDILSISFTFHHVSFSFQVGVKRKIMDSYPDIFYGCEILNMSSQEQYDLRLKIARLDIQN